uniref:Uncharacterized protein n=1 Tax=Rhizophora mucronata TaxID=61149 RepID=A0A2P2JK68_RHIMU
MYLCGLFKFLFHLFILVFGVGIFRIFTGEAFR